MLSKERLTSSVQYIGPYLIQDELGRGGMSIVYRALHSETNEVVALKVLPPQLAEDKTFVRRFIAEGRHASRLRHPNIVRTYEAGVSNGRHYISMELIDGITLSEYLRQRGTILSIDESITILQQVAAGLDHAHEQNLLHRDIKLSNILLSGDLSTGSGRALLSDFGASKSLAMDNTIITVIGHSVGTPTFMSPEQARGGSKIDKRSDIYSLGVVAYTLFTGRLPFKADSQPALLHKIIYETPVAPEALNPHIPPGIAYALKRGMAKDPPMRYPTAVSFASALAEGKEWIPSTPDYLSTPQVTISTPETPVQPHTTHHGTTTQVDESLQRFWRNFAVLTAIFGICTVAVSIMLVVPSGNSLRNRIIHPSLAAPTSVSHQMENPLADRFRPSPTRDTEANVITGTMSNTAVPVSGLVAILPSATMTPTQQATSTAVPQPTNTATPTNTPAPTETFTPLPTVTFTPLPTLTSSPTSTPTNTSSPIPTPTQTPIPTNTLVPPTHTPLSRIQPVLSQERQVLLISPADGISHSGSQLFEWRADFVPPEGHGFELIFWKEGQNPMIDGFGLAAPTTKNTIRVDLGALDQALGELLEPETYFWGVLLVQKTPYHRVQHFSDQRKFSYYRSSSDNSNSGGSGGNPNSGE